MYKFTFMQVLDLPSNQAAFNPELVSIATVSNNLGTVITGHELMQALKRADYHIAFFLSNGT